MRARAGSHAIFFRQWTISIYQQVTWLQGKQSELPARDLDSVVAISEREEERRLVT